jgi:hypothetical protein
MATSSGRSIGRPPHMHSRIRDDLCESGDEIAGEWTPDELLRMNARFVERLEHVIARGLERRPDQAHHPLGDTGLANGRDKLCVRCGDQFTPIRSDMIYCSVGCRQAAYRERRLASDAAPLREVAQ